MLFRNLMGLKRWFAGASTALVLAAGSGALPQANAQEQKDDITELRQRLEALEKQNQTLLKKLDEPQPAILQDRAGAIAPAAAVPADELKKAVDGYLAEKAAKAKADGVTCGPDGYEVGSNRGITFGWSNSQGLGLVGESANKDFRIHIGGRVMFDNVWWTESEALRSGPGSIGVGELQDGSFFRRLRLQIDGKCWEVFEYAMEPDFEQTRNGIVTFDEMWAGITKVPLVGSIRAGHIKIPQGLETYSSSRTLTFFERSFLFDAYQEEFSPGLWFTNNFFDERATYAAALYRLERENNNNGVDIGDGTYSATGRMTLLPIYENDGRCVVHVGLSGSWHKSAQADPGTGGLPTQARFRARPEMRDGIGDFGGAVLASNGTVVTLPGDNNRLVDTGALNCDDWYVGGLEFLSIWGPLSLQAEAMVTTATNVQNTTVMGAPTKDITTGGYYVMASYFLTGENRGYDKRLGRLNSSYVPKINTPFWAVRDEDGHFNLGRGAWEVAIRYSYLNLNDSFVQGGKVDETTVGLNWYLCNNWKMQWQYINGHRKDLGAGPDVLSGVKGGAAGTVQGIGFRSVFEF